MKLNQNHFPFLSILLFLGPSYVFGTHKCVWVRGAVQCRKDSTKQLNVEVRVYDRDGISILKMIDPDDLMGVTFTEADGTFQLDGCGDDFNWIPGMPNLPDPYIRIFHYCNDAKGETIELPEFDTFVPQTHDIGVIVLDDYEAAETTVKTSSSRGDRVNLTRSSSTRSKSAETNEDLPVLVSLPVDDSDSDVSASARPESVGKAPRDRENEKYLLMTKPDDGSETLVPTPKPAPEKLLAHEDGGGLEHLNEPDYRLE